MEARGTLRIMISGGRGESRAADKRIYLSVPSEFGDIQWVQEPILVID